VLLGTRVLRQTEPRGRLEAEGAAAEAEPPAPPEAVLPRAELEGATAEAEGMPAEAE